MRLPGLRIGTLLACCVVLFTNRAQAEPFIAEGQAPLGDPPAEQVARQRAISNARQQALSTALGEMSGPVDATARRSIEAAHAAWTGAYRILEQRIAGDELIVRVEVDIDVPRLAKRLAPRTSREQVARYRLGRVRAERSCGASIDRVRDELIALGAVGSEPTSPVVDLEVKCESLGPVRHTFVHASRVSIEAVAQGRTVAQGRATGLAPQEAAAVEAGLLQVAAGVASRLSAHRRDVVRVRVLDPLPAAHTRRFQRALQERVLGATDVVIAGFEPDGSVWIEVTGELDAETLASQLQAFSLPDTTVVVERIEGADTVVVRLG